MLFVCHSVSVLQCSADGIGRARGVNHHLQRPQLEGLGNRHVSPAVADRPQVGGLADRTGHDRHERLGTKVRSGLRSHEGIDLIGQLSGPGRQGSRGRVGNGELRT